MLETLTGPYTLKQIFQDHWGFFLAAYGDRIRPSIVEEVAKVMRCRDPLQQGCHRYRCPDHPEVERIIPHSCKSRFCSSCGKVASDHWMEQALAAFLDVPYHHLVFTLPQELRNVFAWDRKLLGTLFGAAKDTVIEWCRDEAGYIPGIVMVMRTFGSDLKFNPRIHMLMTEGGLSPERTQWIRNEFIPWKMLKSRWKYHVVTALKPRLKALIREQRAGIVYGNLGTGRSFRGILGRTLAEDLVRLDGDHTCYGTVYHHVHRSIRQTASHG